MIQVICDICGEASQKPFGFRPENGLAFFGTENLERYPYHLCGTDRAGLNNLLS